MKHFFGWPLCMIRGCWYTITTSYWRDWTWVSGHSYIEQPDTPPNVSVLICENCGHLSVSWSWEPIPYKTGDKVKQVNL